MKKLVLLAMMCVLLVGVGAFAQDAEPTFTPEQIEASPYLQSVLARQGEMYDTTEYAKEGPYRIALAAQGTSNSWSALFDEHARWYAEELGPDVIGELLYADAQASADIQVPQVEDLLAQEPDALILVPMGAAALAAPVERAMAQGVPVILCASSVDTDNFVTEVGTNLYASGSYLAQYLVDQLGGEGNVIVMAGIPGASTSDVMQAGAEAVFAANPGITVLDIQPGNWSTAEAKSIMETWLAQYGDEIDGVWSGGAQMSQGIVSAYLDAGQAIPPIGGGEFGNGFLRLAIENEISYAAWQYPNAMVTLCMDTALAILRGEPVPRFIDFQDSIPNTQNFTDAEGETYYNAEWSDDVFGPILFPEARLEALGFVVQGS
ncbi:MAG: substrate-binding domain-containing protein [Chloroflexota bacterium]|nr:substrate-binding domain-containing protein [Chloroflexota bacterium]